MTRTSRTIVTLLLAAGTVSTTLAAELPGFYPKDFDKTGVINSPPNPNNQRIVISDGSFTVSPGIVVHTPVVRNGGTTLLKSGQSIGYTVTGAGPTSNGTVSEVWVFPAGYVPGKK